MRKTLFFIVIIFISTEIYSQTPYVPEIVPPETAELMKYIDHPVDISYGLASVEIPLYLITQGDIKIPIILKYHGSGLKVYDQSDRVGMGWSIDFGPSLGRKINNRPDEGHYIGSNAGYPNDNGSPNYYTAKLYPYLRDLANGQKDEYPDTFYYKLLSKSGKFMFNRGFATNYSTPIIETIPYEPIKIDNGGSTSLKSFKIWDDNGFLYSFGVSLKNSNFYGYSETGMGNITSYKIHEVISPNRVDTISYRYNVEVFNEVITAPSDFVAVEDVFSAYLRADNVMPSHYHSGLDDPVRYPFVTMGKTEDPIVYNINPTTGVLENVNFYSAPIYPVPTAHGSPTRDNQLTRIETQQVLVEIHGLSVGRTKRNIEKITVKDKATNKIIRTIEFTHTTFGGQREKSKLDQIRILGENNQLVETYSFDYHNPDRVPHPSSKGADPWGYYVGGSLSNMVPWQQTVVNCHTSSGTTEMTINVGDGSTIGSSSPASQNGLLKSVTFPTGRKSTFYYEVNQRRNRNGIVEPTGGNRIARIEEYEPVSGNTITRTFKYGMNEDGAGTISREISADDYMFEYYTYGSIFGLEVPIIGDILRVRIYTSSPFNNLFYANGAIVHYQYVTEYVDGRGKTEYVFKEANNHTYHFKGTTIAIDGESDWTGGELLSKTEYKQIGNIYKPVKRETYQYDHTLRPSRTIPYGMCYERMRRRISDDIPDEQRHIQSYNGFQYETREISSGSKKLTRQTVEYFDGDRTLSEVTTYQYGNMNHMFPTRKTVSGTQTEVTTYKYPQDVSWDPRSLQEMDRLNLINSNILSPVMFSEFTSGTKKWCTQTIYATPEGNPQNNVNVPLVYSVSEGPSATDLRIKVRIDSYDQMGNPTQVNDTEKNTVYLWGYGGHQLIAQIQGATYNEVQQLLTTSRITRMLTSLSPTAADMAALDALRQQLPDSFVTTIRHQPSIGISSITDPRGKTTEYLYDPAGRLKLVKDESGNLESYEYKMVNE